MACLERLWLSALVALAPCALALPARPLAAQAAPSPRSAVQRGRYLATAIGCADCHSPKNMTADGPVPDEGRAFAGHPAGDTPPAVPPGVLGPTGWGAMTTPDMTAWAGPWGTSFAANLTPDPTGLGGWTRSQFIQAMRTGKHMGAGRPILPPMPWQDLSHLSDADLGAIFAYLRTLKPVHNVVPAPVPPPESAGH